jgi:MFS family permease
MALTLPFPYRYRVGILLFFLILIKYLDRVTISLVGVRVKAAFHLTNTQFGYVLGAFALAYALFEVPSALLGDRWGQRRGPSADGFLNQRRRGVWPCSQWDPAVALPLPR